MENVFRQERGQALLIVILIMVIALTVGLSLVSRSIVNVNNTNAEAGSQKAFQAAEAGVEIGLQKQLGTSDITIGSTTIAPKEIIQQVVVHPIEGSSIILNNGNPVAQDEGIDVWLTNYPDYSGTPWTGTIYVYWGSKSACNDAAIEAIVIQGASSKDTTATINRYGADGCGTSLDASLNRIGDNKFSGAVVGGSVGGKTFNFSTAISVKQGLLMRLIPLYTNTPIAIVGYDTSNPANLQNFPSQGRFITATGSYGTVQRKVSFFQGYPLLPSEFFYGIFQK